MNLSLFIAKKISFRQQRSISTLMIRLAILSIAVAIAVMEVSLSLVQGFESAIREKVIGFVSHIQIGNYGFLVDGSNEIEPLTDSTGTVNRIKKESYVQSISPYILKWAMIEAKEEMEVLMLKGIDKDYNFDFFRRNLISGKLPSFKDSTESLEILISQKQASLLKLKEGDKATILFIQDPIKRRPVRVSGIYNTGLEEFDRTTVFCDLRLLQKVMKWKENEVMGYEVNLKSSTQLESKSDSINNLSQNLWEAIPVTQIPAYSPIFDWLKIQHQNVWVILILMILVAVINMSSVVLIMIIERTHMIGVLNALGMNAIRLQGVFVWKMGMLMLSGMVLGNLVGLGGLALHYHFLFLHLDPENYFLDTVPVAWVWDKFLIINVSALIICTLTMYIPTLIINRISPVKAIQFR